MIEYFKNITWLSPWWLLLALLPIAWYVARRMGMFHTSTPMTFSHLDGSAECKTWRSRLTWLPDVLRLLALLFFTIAMARPQLTLKEEIINAEGIDIMMSIDLSSSMLAKDFDPDRLTVSKQVANEFVEKRPHDRVGLAVFAGEAFTQCPLTTDHLILSDFLNMIEVGNLADGTAIGMGLATAVNRLKDSDAKSKVVILLTDGVNNQGYVDPITAAQIAKEFDVKVYTIGVGTEGTALAPINRLANGSYHFGTARVNIDEDLLKEISELTGGKYYRAIDRESLENIYAEINELEKTKIEVNVFKRYKEMFRPFLLAGLFLFLLDILLRNTILRVLN